MAESSTGASTSQQTDGNQSGDDPLSEFGANEWLVDEMFQRYQKDPSSVDKAWESFFEKHGDGSTNGGGKPNGSAPGPSPAKSKPASSEALVFRLNGRSESKELQQAHDSGTGKHRTSPVDSTGPTSRALATDVPPLSQVVLVESSSSALEPMTQGHSQRAYPIVRVRCRCPRHVILHDDLHPATIRAIWRGSRRGARRRRGARHLTAFGRTSLATCWRRAGDGGLRDAQERAGLHTSRERMCEAEHESLDQRSGTTLLPRPG